jgi:hypothetical protein
VQKMFKYFNQFVDAERNGLDVLILDEAHRIRETSVNRYTRAQYRTGRPQIDELIGAARVPVFLLDQNQVVRPGEMGAVESISAYAGIQGLQVHVVELPAQFRCGGSASYVRCEDEEAAPGGQVPAAAPGAIGKRSQRVGAQSVRVDCLAGGVAQFAVAENGSMISESVPFLESDVADAAGDRSFARGVDYVRYVRGLRIEEGRARASIQAKNVYTVELEWLNLALSGRCSCPHNLDGNFCKHLVAVALATLDKLAGHAGADFHSDGAGESGPLDDYLSGLDRAALLDLVRTLMIRDESVLRLVEARAVADGAVSVLDPTELLDRVNRSLSVRGFIDYRLSFEVARDAEAMLDELAELLDAGAAEAVRPALERAVTRLRKITLGADDSAGGIGASCRRAADLHALACRESRPDPVKLARWLVKFRADSPGWPETPLSAYAAAFDTKACTVYRKAVRRLDEQLRDRDHYQRFEVDQMLLELADHDGDVDEAERLLSRDEEHTQYGAIIARLRAAGRHDEAMSRLDQAVAARRIGNHVRTSDGFWIAPEDAAQAYLAVGRSDDAIAILRAHFVTRPGPESLDLLLQAAGQLGTAEAERKWAISSAEKAANGQFGNGSALVLIALAAGDLFAAWAAAEQFGAGDAWEQLAQVSANEMPIAAAELYRPQIEKLLPYANTKNYPQIAELLVTMRDLYREGGDEAAMSSYIDEIRSRYVRRTSLLAALDRKEL